MSFFKHEQYQILTSQLYHLHKHLYETEIPYQAICNKMALDFIPYELKDFKKLERALISRRILFKKTAIMHAKGEFAKIKGSICNIPIKAADICHILPRPAVSNGLITVKLKRDLKYRDLVYFEPVRRHTVYQALTYLKSYNKFYEDISIANGFSSEDTFKFSDIVEIQGHSE